MNGLMAPHRSLMLPGRDFLLDPVHGFGDASGLPRNGLVALYDPYRDAYGRNCSPTSQAGWTNGAMTGTTTRLEGGSTESHYIYVGSGSFRAGSVVTFQVVIKPVGRKRFLINLRGTGDPWALFDVDAVSVLATNAILSSSIVANGDGSYTLTITGTYQSANSPSLYSMPDSATSWANRPFAGDTSKGFEFIQWQINFGGPIAYSTPAGAPGTLQTATDYSGRGNNLTLGATTGASTDDPAYTGVGLLFAADYAKSGNLTGVTMAGDWSLPIVLKPSGTTGAIVSLADATAADQYQAIEFNGSTKVRIHTKNGATDTTSDDLTVSNSTVQLLSLVSSGDTLTLKLMNTGASVTATNADPTGTPRLVVGGLGTSTIGTLADGVGVNMLPLYGRALGASEETRIYRHVKSLFAGRGVTVA